jgi:hypothetical protein
MDAWYCDVDCVDCHVARISSSQPMEFSDFYRGHSIGIELGV